MDNRSANLVKNTFILTFGSICTKGIMFIMTPLFTRWLSQSNYGMFDLLVTYLSLLVPIVTVDIKEAVFRFLIGEEYKGREKEIITNGILVHILGFVVCLAIMILILLILPQKRIFIICYMIMVIGESLYDLWVVIARGIRKIPIYAKGNILYVVIMALLSILFIKYFNWGLYGLMLSYTLGYLASCLYMCIACKTHNYIDLKYINFRLLYEMIKYALPMLPNAIAWWIVNVSDRTIISVFLGVEANAILAVTNKLPNLCQQIFSKFHLSWQETAVDNLEANDRDIFYSNVMNNLFKIMSSIVIMIMALNFIYFKMLFTDEYFYGYYLSPVLLVAILIYMMAQFLGGIYIAQMKSKRNGMTTIVSAVINLVIDLLLINKIGLWAAVISTILSYLVLFSIRYLDIKKNINLIFDKETKIFTVVLICVFAINYLNNNIFSIINAILCSVFVFIKNKDFILRLLCKKKKGN